MQLPANFLAIVHTAASVLQSLAARLRARAERSPQAPELWLSVRDLEGLAGRLMDWDEPEWREGMATLTFSGQDIGVLDEVLAPSGSPAPSLTQVERGSLLALRDVLQAVL